MKALDQVAALWKPFFVSLARSSRRRGFGTYFSEDLSHLAVLVGRTAARSPKEVEQVASGERLIQGVPDNVIGPNQDVAEEDFELDEGLRA